jgi:alginate O-acetyltransferase complex protein AlgI
MLFSSPEFFVFFAVFVVIYRFIPANLRLPAIIASSTLFYAWWRVEYVALPYVLSFIGFWGGLAVARATSSEQRHRRFLIFALVLFAPLFVFKYANFFSRDVVGALFGVELPLLPLTVPLGISFVTFTIYAYVADVFRGKFPVEKKPEVLLGYVLFFPHLIAGPILRPRELIPQVAKLPSLVLGRMRLGAAIFTIGLLKKLVFADQIGRTVDAIYASHDVLSAWEYWLAIYGFSAQIYCDFSGYTDMAIGLAYVLHVRFPNNFARPYLSTSLTDFWRRWHITLSHWLRDYVYIPLGGSRGGLGSTIRNIIVTMVLGGLWHGANWTFVLWGLAHGVGMGGQRIVAAAFPSLRLPKLLALLVTFHFVAFAWILFRSPTLTTAADVFSGAFVSNWSLAPDVLAERTFVLALLAVFFATHCFDSHARLRLLARKVPPQLFWPVMVVLWVLAITISQGSSSNFIYFDF